MIDTRRTMLLGTVLTAGALLAVPAGVEAQSTMGDMMMSKGRLDLDVHGGAALPTNELTDYVEPGLDFGAGATWWLNDHVGVRIAGNVAALDGEDEEPQLTSAMPNVRLWHYGGGFEFDVGGRDARSPWSLNAAVGAGATTFDTDLFLVPGGSIRDDITHTYPNVNAGVELGYDMSERVSAEVGTSAFVTFYDAADLTSLREMNPAADPLDVATLFPITATLRVQLPNS